MGRAAQPALVLRREIPLALLPLFRPLLAVARNCGIGVTGTRGIGKSTLLTLIAWLDAIYLDHALVVIDPIGAIIARFFTLLAGFRARDQAREWAKIRYLNPSGPETVVPTPLYYATGIGDESAFAKAQRFPDCIARLDPRLTTASVQGFNPLWDISTAAGQVLATLGFQVTEMADLLTHPDHWLARLDQAEALDPAIATACDYLRTTYRALPSKDRERRTDTLLTKLRLFTDPVMRAQFGAALPGIDWREVMTKKLKVFIDLSQEHNYQTRQFKMLWLFMSLMDFIRRFGPVAGVTRSEPLTLMIDEITFMTAQGKVGENPLVADLDELINRLSRNYNIWVVASFQEPYQIEDPKLLKSLLSLATQFFGRFSDPESARLIADRTMPYAPHLVKDTRAQYATIAQRPTQIDEVPSYYSLREQNELGRQRFDQLNRFDFLVSRTAREGDRPLPVERFSIAPFSGLVDLKPDRTVVADAEAQLNRRDGRSVAEILTEIEARLAPDPSSPAVPAATSPGSPGPRGRPTRPSRMEVVAEDDRQEERAGAVERRG